MARSPKAFAIKLIGELDLALRDYDEGKQPGKCYAPSHRSPYHRRKIPTRQVLEPNSSLPTFRTDNILLPCSADRRRRLGLLNPQDHHFAKQNATSIRLVTACGSP